MSALAPWQTDAWHSLSSALVHGRLHHALLFTGPRGTGKTSTARILAKSLRCPNAVDFVPCNRCSECEEIASGPYDPAQRPAYAYTDKGSMATIGRSKAVAWVGKARFSGYPAWIMWLGVHLIFLVGFRNRISVLMQWAYSYFTYKRGARVITGLSGEGSAGSA